MIAPGAVISSDRITATIAAGQVPDKFIQGIGIMNNGSLAIDTNAVSGTVSNGGFAQSAAGALYGTVTATGTDVWVQGVRCTVAGAVVYESAAATAGQNGNPITANGRLAII